MLVVVMGVDFHDGMFHESESLLPEIARGRHVEDHLGICVSWLPSVDDW